MATLSELQTQVSRDLRDASNNVWSSAETQDLINAGIDKIGDLAPREIVTYSTTVSSGVSSYALPTTLSRVYRIDIYSSSDSYLSTYLPSSGDGAATGWEVHDSIIFLSPLHIPTASSKLRIFGYGIFTQLSASSSTTDLDQRRIWALRSFCKAEALYALLFDRAKFQQWQTDQTNTDVSLLQLAQMANLARGTWAREERRLRTLRKL